jgi:hypothetical protein
MFFRKLLMSFRNRIKVPDYLEERVKEILTDEGIFKLEGFYDEYYTILSNIPFSEHLPPTETREQADPPADRDLFIDRFIGTMLWLIKYRTLTTVKNSTRKLAFLDLSFDSEVPKIVDRLLQRYDTDTIKKNYESMDLRCKSFFTGELHWGGEPRFLISPLWAKNPDPHPFHIAAQIFVEDVGHKALLDNGASENGNRFINLLEKRFMEFTQPIEDMSAEIFFLWIANR